MLIIKIIQEVLNKTQQDIANDLGVSRQTISMWYSGYKISKKNLEVINEKYNIPMYLLEKAQVTGVNFNSNEVELIKNSLVQKVYNCGNNNIYKKIFDLVGVPALKSVNYNDFIKKLKFDNILLKDISMIDAKDQKKYLFVIKVFKRELNEILNIINSLGVDKTNYAYLIVNSDEDNIEVFVFGGE